MARVESLSGVFAVCSAVTLALQGCGSSSGPTAPPSGPTVSPRDKDVVACLNGWKDDECCCQQCPSLTDGPGFVVTGTDNCTLIGGQCKPKDEVFYGTSESFYFRPPPSALAHVSLREKKAWTGEEGTEQHHVIGGWPDEIAIVFHQHHQELKRDIAVTIRNKDDPSAFETTQNTTKSAYSFFEDPQGWNGYSGSSRGSEYFKCAKADGHANYQNATCFYTSDVIHQTVVTGLTASTQYEYQVVGESEWRPFRTPPAVRSPIKIGCVADLGQTTDSVTTMQHMEEMFDNGEIDMIVFPGDLSYADGYAPAWDDYGRVSEFLFSKVPTSYGVGNHESTSGLENNINFIPRYGWQSSESKKTSSSNLWFSYEAGYAHVIMLCSYCDTSEGSVQYNWLQNDLENVNREDTPWVVMSWHVPFYTSSLTHPMETHPPFANGYQPAADGDQQRANMENLIHQHGVDIAIQGHVHSYERTEAVFNNQSDCTGTVYITIGDGGNHEGPACGWVQNLPWSAKKETSFGFGVLNIINATDAEWVWHRNQNSLKEIADSTPLKSTATRCNTVAASPPATARPITV